MQGKWLSFVTSNNLPFLPIVFFFLFFFAHQMSSGGLLLKTIANLLSLIIEKKIS